MGNICQFPEDKRRLVLALHVLSLAYRSALRIRSIGELNGLTASDFCRQTLFSGSGLVQSCDTVVPAIPAM